MKLVPEPTNHTMTRKNCQAFLAMHLCLEGTIAPGLMFLDLLWGRKGAGTDGSPELPKAADDHRRKMPRGVLPYDAQVVTAEYDVTGMLAG